MHQPVTDVNSITLYFLDLLSYLQTTIELTKLDMKSAQVLSTQTGHQWKQVRARTISGWACSQRQRSAWTSSSSSREVKTRLASGSARKRPEPLSGLHLWRIGRQEHQVDPLRQGESRTAVPPSPIQDQHDVCVWPCSHLLGKSGQGEGEDLNVDRG